MPRTEDRIAIVDRHAKNCGYRLSLCDKHQGDHTHDVDARDKQSCTPEVNTDEKASSIGASRHPPRPLAVWTRRAETLRPQRFSEAVSDRAVVSHPSRECARLPRTLCEAARCACVMSKPRPSAQPAAHAASPLRRAQRAAHSLKLTVGDAMDALEGHLARKGLRVADFFHELDASGDGSLEIGELLQGLSALCRPSKYAVARLAETRAGLDAARRELAAAEQRGATALLERLEAYTRKWQLRVADLFVSASSTSGSGSNSSPVVRGALQMRCFELGIRNAGAFLALRYSVNCPVSSSAK